MTKIVKWKEIVNGSKEMKKHVETKHEEKNLPNLNKGETLYVLAKAVRNPGKDVEIPTSIVTCPKCTGTNINENLSQSNYLKVSNKVLTWFKTNVKAPNYITWGKDKISVRLANYSFCRIIVFYENNNKMPKTCLFDNGIFYNKSNSIKKYGRSTKTGCDNRGQNTDYWCGPHMAQEIIRNLTGVVIPQSKIAAIMGTTTSGTGHSGIDTFFAWFNKSYNYTLKWDWKNFSDVGWSGLKKIHESKDQDAGEHECYRDTVGHYTNYDKIYDDTVDVHNSLGDYCSNGCHCGYIENRNKSTAKRYLEGISQKSILVVTRVK